MKIGIIVAMGGEFRLVEALLSGKKEQEIRGVPLCDRTVGGEGNRLDTMWYR